MPSPDPPSGRRPTAAGESAVVTISSHPLRLELPVSGADAHQDWRAAHDEASRALAAGRRASVGRRAEAYAVYVAAADREDTALRTVARSAEVRDAQG